MRQQRRHRWIGKLTLQFCDRRELPPCLGQPPRQASAGVLRALFQRRLPARLPDERAVKRNPIVGPLVPMSSGLLWEDEQPAGKWEGLRIGVLKQGFGHPNSEADVDAKVRAAAERFKSLGASVADVSVPEHLTLGFPVWAAIRGDAACVTLLEMNGFGLGYEGLYPLSAIEAAMKWRDHADEFADTLKIATILSKYTLHRYGGHYYAKAQNLRRRLRYD